MALLNPRFELLHLVCNKGRVGGVGADRGERERVEQKRKVVNVGEGGALKPY